jgi:carbonic anhydrase/acetyltransferase-like protein (isoleucine patch superfamily)
VVLHGCRIGDGVLIGISSILLNNSRVEDECIIGAGSLVTEGARLKGGSLYYGRPARFVRKLKPAEIKMNYYWAKKYAGLAEIHQRGLILEAAF